MYLLGPDYVIKGRGLDTYALALMLNEIFAHPDLTYGTGHMDPLFDNLVVMDYADADGQPTEYGVRKAADYLADSQLHAGDTTMCRQMLGDFLYYLAPKTGQAMKEGTKYLIDEYILGRNDIWNSADDTLKIVGFAEILDDLLSKAARGSRVAGLKIPGEYLVKGKAQSKVKNLRKLGGKLNVVIFHTDGCNVCAAEIKAARAMAADRQANVFLINVDDILASDPALASRLFDQFDLSALPYIICTDKKGYILGRYLSLQ
jgi:hypothetical protein